MSNNGMKCNLRKINWIIIQKLNKVFRTSVFDEIYWKYRSCKGDWNNGSYWESVNHSHRKFLLKTIDKNKSLLEVGCNSGPNLRLLKDFNRCVGIDINKKAIEEGKKRGLDIRYGKADKLDFDNKSFDYVLFDAILMYVGPDKIDKSIKEAIRVAREGIIIIDFHKEGFSSEGQIELGHWVRDYKKLFNKYGLDSQITKITEEDWKSYSWEKLGNYIVVWIN